MTVMTWPLRLRSSLFATPLVAQDRGGNNTPGEWIVDHHKIHGLWDSMCDHRTTDGVTEKRCYLRYVDAFSYKPKFGAVFTFITPMADGYRVEFGFEPNTVYKKDGFRITQNNEVTWILEDQNCIRSGECVWEGTEADAFVAALAAPSDPAAEFKQDFIDNHGQTQSLSWDLAPFAPALADFNAQSLSRGLR